MGSEVPAIAMLALSLLFAGVALRVPRLLHRPRKRIAAQEYGARTGHKTWVQFRMRYGVLALLFVAFDMEMVFMFPWAVVYRREGIVALLDMFVFIAILASAIVFAWKEGAFDWEA